MTAKTAAGDTFTFSPTALYRIETDPPALGAATVPVRNTYSA